MWQRLGAPVVPQQSPRQHVFRVDARRTAIRSLCTSERVAEVPAVVEIEERRLQLGAHAVCGLHAVDEHHERISAPGRHGLSGRTERVAAPDGVLRKWQPIDDMLEERQCALVLPFSSFRVGEPGLRMHVAGQGGERSAVGAGGGGQPSGVELDVPELNESRGSVLSHWNSERERQVERLASRARPAEQLARVRDTAVRRDARREERHPVVGDERLVIPAQIEECIPQCAEGGGVARVDPESGPCEYERGAEAVARDVERRKPGGRELGRTRVCACGAQGLSRKREVARIPGLPGALLIREPEEEQCVPVPACAQPALELRDVGGGVVAREPGEQLPENGAVGRARRCSGRCGRATRRRPPEQKGGDERSDHNAAEHQLSSHVASFRWSEGRQEPPLRSDSSSGAAPPGRGSPSGTARRLR
jgi:hypothetical protein